ncbi:hypothetical protein TNCV_3503481 [Trichonephila clavipes]|uniref:Uncharacterized protein n=1 Tax=Trichonephila clavipes TaxID=2585209 RepID=A0A8X6V2R4_TRICX|nr:hypothetical protein TNCV_3503481 [Trichonephila clavipes]
MFEKAYTLLVGPSVSSKEFVAVDSYNVCTALIMAEKDILEFVQSSKNFISADSNDKIEMNMPAPIHTPSEIRNMKICPMI